jgi:hypothetical protein
MNDIDVHFVARMEQQLKKKSYKGDFNEWTPTKEDCLTEIKMHVDKLKHKIDNVSEFGYDGIRETAADTANFLMKMFGIADNPQ